MVILGLYNMADNAIDHHKHADTGHLSPPDPPTDRPPTYPLILAEKMSHPLSTEAPPNFTEASSLSTEAPSNSPEAPPSSTEAPPSSTEALPHSPEASVDVNANLVNRSSAQDNGISLRQSINRRPVAHMERFRHKRQTLQDMARPLKHWLYQHRGNPYPSKSDKLRLAANSHMTLTQVSNWFANARRRLKNTVRQPEITWEKRIQMYNSCIEGNQERLSVSSDDSDDELMMMGDADGPLVTGDNQDPIPSPNKDSPSLLLDQTYFLSDRPPHPTSAANGSQSAAAAAADNTRLLNSGHDDRGSGERGTSLQDGGQQVVKDCGNCSASCEEEMVHSSVEVVHSGDAVVHSGQETGDRNDKALERECDMEDTVPQKYKHTMLQRYLNDSCLTFQMPAQPDSRHRNLSGSLSSHDFEEIASSRGSPMRENICEDEFAEFSRNWSNIESRVGDDLYWKEISAALALTTLSRSAAILSRPVSEK